MEVSSSSAAASPFAFSSAAFLAASAAICFVLLFSVLFSSASPALADSLFELQLAPKSVLHVLGYSVLFLRL